MSRILPPILCHASKTNAFETSHYGNAAFLARSPNRSCKAMKRVRQRATPWRIHPILA
jgi:hypothetical protein